jgi:hypothetical protein
MAASGQIPGEWIDIRNYIIVSIKEILDEYNTQYPDSKTFEEEK